MTLEKISRLREELDQGYVPNDQSYVLDVSRYISDKLVHTCNETDQSIK